jgi:tellurite resistance protein
MENNEVKHNRLKFFPIMMFAIIMGFSGLAIVWEKSSEILGLPKIIGTSLAYFDMGLFLVILGIYLIKMGTYLEAVKKEFAHPVRINFFAATAISFLLISIAFHSISHLIALYFFYIGTILQTFFTLYTISYWINNNLEIAHSNPAWFIPIVGNVLVPVSGAGFIDNSFLMYYFSIGIFFWIILTAIIINRIVFHHQLAVKFMPTIFIFIAPPAVAFIAYIKMYHNLDVFAHFLYDLGLFFTFLIFFMYKNFTKLKFFISWWAFTFPLAAITISSLLMYKLTHIAIYSYFTYLFISITTIVVGIVTYRTIQHILKKDICKPE